MAQIRQFRRKITASPQRTATSCWDLYGLSEILRMDDESMMSSAMVRWFWDMIRYPNVTRKPMETDGKMAKASRNIRAHTSPMISNLYLEECLLYVCWLHSVILENPIPIIPGTSDCFGSDRFFVPECPATRCSSSLLSAVWILCAWHESLSHAATNQWIDLRENPQETIDFPIKYRAFL